MIDAQLLSAMENIEEDTSTTGKCNNFEYAVAYILPKDPLAKRRNKYNNHNQAHIYDTSAQGQGFGYKVGVINTGVHYI